MLQTPPTLGFLITHSLQRLGNAALWLTTRARFSHDGGLSLAVAVQPLKLRLPQDGRPLAGLAGRLLQGLRDPLGTPGHGGAPPPTDPHRTGELAAARQSADQWRDRAEAAERRIVELETQLAASEMTALELRSRVVCLHGKLATTNATVRYQTMTLALEGQHASATAETSVAASRS